MALQLRTAAASSPGLLLSAEASHSWGALLAAQKEMGGQEGLQRPELGPEYKLPQSLSAPLK